MKNRWNSRIKSRKKISNEKDQIEEFSQKEVGKDNIKENLRDMEDRNRSSRKREGKTQQRRKYWKKIKLWYHKKMKRNVKEERLKTHN